MKRTILLSGLFLIMFGIVWMIVVCPSVRAAETTKLLQVGVYDSRAIALAYGAKYSKENLKKMQAELAQAEKDHDIAKMKELMIQAQKQQLKKNWQSMGLDSVHEYFDPVRDKIPAIVQQSGVDILINK